MKPLKITYVRLSGKTEPYAALIGGRMVNRACNESLENFQARCTALLEQLQNG